MQGTSRLLLLGTFSLTLLASLVHAACTAATNVDSGTSEAFSGHDPSGYGYGGGYGNGYDDGSGYGYDDGYGYGGAINVAPDYSP